jgi:DHA2 family multidrug resistance protein
MDQLGFAAAAIASTGAIGGAVSLPLPPLIGWLSDRAGRKRFLALCYLGGIAGLMVLAVSVSLWHFWITALLGTILGAVNMGVGSALVTDLVPRESLGRGMSLFNASVWMGGIIGFAGTGYGIQNLGMVTTLVIGVCLTLVATVLLIPIRQVGPGKGAASHLKTHAA